MTKFNCHNLVYDELDREMSCLYEGDAPDPNDYEDVWDKLPGKKYRCTRCSVVLEPREKEEVMETRTICLYHRDGRVFKYDVSGETDMDVSTRVVEHIQKICDFGWYRHCDGKVYELIPVIVDGNRGIYKVKSTDIVTNYPDRTERT